MNLELILEDVELQDNHLNDNTFDVFFNQNSGKLHVMENGGDRELIYETILKEVELPIHSTSEPYICHKLLVAINGRTWFDKQSFVEIDKAMLAFPEFAQVFEQWQQKNKAKFGCETSVVDNKKRPMLLNKAIKLCI